MFLDVGVGKSQRRRKETDAWEEWYLYAEITWRHTIIAKIPVNLQISVQKDTLSKLMNL